MTRLRDYDEREADERQNDREEAMEHDRAQLVRAARNLLDFDRDLTIGEIGVLRSVLRVFDPPPPIEEEPDLPF